MAENPRPPSVPPPTDPDGSVHRHTDEIEKSRARSSASDRPASANQPLPPVGARSGRNTPMADGRPGSGARVAGPSRPGSSNSGRPLTAMASEELLPLQMSKKDPLPPIGGAGMEEAEIEIVEATSDIIANTMAGGNVKTKQIAKLPRVVSYRPGAGLDDDIPPPEEPKPKPVTKTTSLAVAEERTVTGKDGNEMVVKSIDCQTEWSWLKDMELIQRLSATPGGKFSRASTVRAPTQTPGGLLGEEEEDLELDSQNVAKPVPSRSSERRVSRVASEQSHGGSKSQRSQRSKADPGLATPGEDAPGVQPGYTDDTYGIPILELSSDSDYQRESDKQKMKAEEEGKDGGPSDTIFQKKKQESIGQCEFCGGEIKPFPTLEDQTKLSPAELYCCDDYRDFLQYMLTQHAPPGPEEGEKKLIDITPHPPHGSKQARRAAKERAAQRMREREIQRQQAAISGMGGGFGGGGGGGASNFYQSNTGPQGHKISPAYSKIIDRKEEAYSESSPNAPNAYLARQMKTINYQLSSQKCLEEGWTLRPPSPMLDQEADNDVFEPQPILPHWAEGGKDKKEAGLVQKFYPDGSKFVILFPDGTGNVYYPSGRPAISISSIEKGLYTYLAHHDSDDDPNVLAVFDPDGHATSYHSNGMVRICLDPIGGTELDPRGCRKRRWTWKDQLEHVHAPPIQPITFAITPNLAVRISSQESITLTFTHSAKSCRFQVGARLKLVNRDNAPPAEVDEELLYRDEVKNRIETLFSKVSNLLKFPKSPKLDKLPGPSHLTSRQEKMDRLRESYSRSAKRDKDKKGSMPVITVN